MLEQRSHRGLVAVDEGTKYTIFVYWDPFYEQVLYNYLIFTLIFFQLFIFTMIFLNLKLPPILAKLETLNSILKQ